MYANTVYTGEKNEDITNFDKPLLVTAAGCYKQIGGETCRPNGRKDYQLIYVSDGKVRFNFDGQKKIIAKGNIILFRPNVPQIYELCIDDMPGTYWIHFTGRDVERIIDCCGIPKDEKVFFTGGFYEYELLFQRILQELQLRNINYNELINTDLKRIFLLIGRQSKENNIIGHEMLAQIEQAILYFQKNYNKEIIIENYVKDLGVSANWFTQKFKETVKAAPLQYIMSLRITNAMFLIDNSDYNMSQIARAIGYENSMYFSRVFKKHTGMTPTEYKHRNRNNN